MKKFASILMAAAMLLCIAGCSLFSKTDMVKLGDYEHTDPDGISYDTRTVLKNDGFGADLSGYASSAAYPDNMKYDEEGNPVGMYDYDPATGLAKGWTNITDGSYTAFDAGKQVDLGKPDESKMVTIAGDVTMYVVVYGKDGAPVESDAYLMLSDASAKDTVISAMKSVFGLDYTAESDTVLKCVADKDAIAAEMATAGVEGDVTADSYIDYLKGSYGLREDAGENPYKPYAGHKDPTDIDYDRKVVLTGNGQASVEESLADCVASQTDILYGKDGDMVAAYTYIEGKDKASTDKIAESYKNEERVSDTAIMIAYTGDEMASVLDRYIGCNVIKDRSVAEYTRMIEETFFSVVYEG